jgi:hypothetical protein
MIGLQLLLVASFCTLALAGSLKGDLKAAGISAVFPGDSGYATASAACT